MALIGKIRKNMWLVVVFLAVALAGFIIQDMTNGQSSGLFNNKTTLGSVAGQKIDYFDVQRTEAALYNGGGEEYARHNSVWNYYVEKAIIDKKADKIGIGVGADELAELEFGTNLSPLVRSFYGNPQTGQVDRNQLNEIKKAVDEGTVSNPEFALRFNELRKQIIKTAKQSKLDVLVAKAMYTPTWYAEAMDKINNETVTFDYVSVPYTSILDTDVKLTDSDYEKYIKKYPVRYTNKEEVRNVAYISYDVKPTQADSSKIFSDITALAEKFKTTDNDSAFAASNNGFMGTTFVKTDDLSGKLKDNIKSLSVGQTFGPYIESSSYVVAKLINKKVIADSAKAQHILRSVANGDPTQLAAANKYIDSLRTLITSGQKSFSELATANSQDPGSAAKGGDLGSFAPGMMVGPFNDAVFNGQVGGIYKVTTQFGVHLIKVNNFIFKNKELKYQLAYINTPITPSEATQDAILQSVMSALENTKNIDALKKLENNNLKIEVAGGLKKNDYIVGQLGGGSTSRDIVKWAFENGTKVGDVSPVAHTYRNEQLFVNSKYVIAALKSIVPAGLATVESVKDQITPQVRNAKKAEMLMTKMSGTDLNAIATANATTVSTGLSANLGNPSIGTAGSEPMVIAKTLALNPGNVSKPIEGISGVFVTKSITKTPAQVEKGSVMQKMTLTQMARSSVNYRLMETLKKNAKIKDTRYVVF
jgi:peptidyl-prolyl cis-trans isomerase D